MSPIGRQFNV